MGPSILFDKSFLQSLSLDEAVWFDAFFYANICPIFFVETLADLSKKGAASGLEPDADVAHIARKTPEMHGGPCVHHKLLCTNDLMGRHPPLNGQIPHAGGVRVKSEDKRGIVFPKSPEAEALDRWRAEAFQEVERRFANAWRRDLERIDLTEIAQKMRKIGITPASCRSLEQARDIAVELVSSSGGHFEKMGLIFEFSGVSREYVADALHRWHINGYRALNEHAPYAAHILAVELFFQIALGAQLIGSERPSNRIDIGYLNYLPFCTLFVSSDKLHRRTAELFLRPDQEFIWGPDLKRDLARLNTYFLGLPLEEREKGAMNLATYPIGNDDDLLIGIWDRHVPNWRDHKDKRLTRATTDLPPVPEDFLRLQKVTPENRDDANLDPNFDFDQMSVERWVSGRRGSWFQLPKSLLDKQKRDDETESTTVCNRPSALDDSQADPTS